MASSDLEEFDDLEEYDFSKLLSIDINELDSEWVRQPRIFEKICRMSSRAKREVEHCKNVLEALKAEKASIIRKNPGKHGLLKITDKAIEAAILEDKEYLSAVTRAMDAKYQSDVLTGAVRALEHKKDSLEYLTRLYLSNYFIGPSEGSGASMVGQVQADEAVKRKVFKRMNGGKG